MLEGDPQVNKFVLVVVITVEFLISGHSIEHFTHATKSNTLLKENVDCKK